MIEWKDEQRTELRHGKGKKIAQLRGTYGKWSFLLTPVEVLAGSQLRLYCKLTTDLVTLTGENDVKSLENGKKLAHNIVSIYPGLEMERSRMDKLDGDIQRMDELLDRMSNSEDDLLKWEYATIKEQRAFNSWRTVKFHNSCARYYIDEIGPMAHPFVPIISEYKGGTWCYQHDSLGVFATLHEAKRKCEEVEKQEFLQTRCKLLAQAYDKEGKMDEHSNKNIEGEGTELSKRAPMKQSARCQCTECSAANTGDVKLAINNIIWQYAHGNTTLHEAEDMACKIFNMLNGSKGVK